MPDPRERYGLSVTAARRILALAEGSSEKEPGDGR